MTTSRQREWQKRKKAEGKCVVCGKIREHYAQHCDEHALAHRVLSRISKRRKVGAKPLAPLKNCGPKPRIPEQATDVQ